MHGAFGNDAFGRIAEKAARFFGTPQYILGQTAAVAAWVVLNSTQLHLGFAWDVYPFIALNLLFSLQAAYAAPLILLAQTRQAARDQAHAELGGKHAERLSRQQMDLLEENTRLTEEIHKLSTEIHQRVGASGG